MTTPAGGIGRIKGVRAIAGAGLLGGVATTSGVALTATSGWLIVRASERPVILTLLTAIVAVRTFGMARPVFRYWERLRSHDVALADLADRRTTAYERLIPLTPARLGRRGRADILTGVVDDLNDVVDAQVRVSVPVLSALVASVLAAIVSVALSPEAGLVIASMATLTALIFALGWRLETRSQQTLLAARAEVARVTALVAGNAGELRAIGAGGRAQTWLTKAHGDLCRAAGRQSHGRAVASGLLLVLTAAATIVMTILIQPGVGTTIATPVAALLVLTPIALGDAFSTLPDAMRMVEVVAGGRRIAGALFLETDQALYGRYWGAVDEQPFLHFELCYYQAIDWGIAHKLKCVEAGAQGEHKIARGYRPTTTYSAHWIAEPGFRHAVAQYLASERRQVASDHQALAELLPFKSEANPESE